MKKKKEKPAAEKPAEGGDAVVMFRISTEMTGIDRESAADDRFEVPADWTRLESVY